MFLKVVTTAFFYFDQTAAVDREQLKGKGEKVIGIAGATGVTGGAQLPGSHLGRPAEGMAGVCRSFYLCLLGY